MENCDELQSLGHKGGWPTSSIGQIHNRKRNDGQNIYS